MSSSRIPKVKIYGSTQITEIFFNSKQMRFLEIWLKSCTQTYTKHDIGVTTYLELYRANLTTFSHLCASNNNNNPFTIHKNSSLEIQIYYANCSGRILKFMPNHLFPFNSSPPRQSSWINPDLRKTESQ